MEFGKDFTFKEMTNSDISFVIPLSSILPQWKSSQCNLLITAYQTQYGTACIKKNSAICSLIITVGENIFLNKKIIIITMKLLSKMPNEAVQEPVSKVKSSSDR